MELFSPLWFLNITWLHNVFDSEVTCGSTSDIVLNSYVNLLQSLFGQKKWRSEGVKLCKRTIDSLELWNVASALAPSRPTSG